jgi:hypothetical protein
VVPLPPDLQARLAAPLAGVSDAIVGYLRAAAEALRAAARPPVIAPVDDALQSYAATVAALRREGMTRGLPADVIERFFALGFSLEQMRQNLMDLERVVAEWSETAPAAKPGAEK